MRGKGVRGARRAGVSFVFCQTSRGEIDDIDNLGNRRVVNEVLCQ